MRRLLSIITVVAAFAAPVVLAQPASAAKAGQLCKAADVGTSQDGLKCTKDGTRFRWAGTAVATKAPTTIKKATVTTKATGAKSTATTKKSTSSAGASTGGGAVKGRFCAKADDGRRATDAKGRKLTCKADAAGKNRWQE